MFRKCEICGKRKKDEEKVLLAPTPYPWTGERPYAYHKTCLIDALKNPYNWEEDAVETAVDIQLKIKTKKEYENDVREVRRQDYLRALNSL